jgi:class 3 adenylate cyclase
MAIATERRIDLGEAPRMAAARDPTLFAHLVDLHVRDMCEVAKRHGDTSSLPSML